MPRPSRVCSTIDCNRVHHAQGYCRRHYHEKVTQAKALHPANGVTAKSAAKAPLAVVR